MKSSFITRVFLGISFLFCLPAISQNFTWLKGSNTSSIAGVYGTQGVPAPGNTPGGRHGCSTWTDASGNLWLFGGEGYASVANLGWLNDLWKYNPTTNQWTWIRGANTMNAPGVYGTQGVAAPGNNPGAREFGVTWTDASGNFWLFGGDGYDGTSTFGRLGDLWKYNPTTNQWTWMKGPNTLNTFGNYGTQNIAAPGNFPGCRYGPAVWTDNTGKFWMYGGRGFATSNQGFLGDLWRFDPGTNNWTWVNGSSGIANSGIFGIMSVPASGNTPGSRQFPAVWNDASGNLVMYAGQGYATSPTPGYLSDMWTYNISTGMWTWINGPSVINQGPVYGAITVPSAPNRPGARTTSAGWKDAMGNYWLFGGLGFDLNNVNRLNDLWRYNPVTNEWAWMKGANIGNQSGIYGAQGVPAPANMPGARDYNTWWKNNGANFFWMMGGEGYDITNNPPNHMNDLWGYTVPCSPDSVNTTSKSMCSGNSTSLTAFNVYPSSVNWYTTPSSGSSIGTGSVLSLPTLTAQGTTSVYTYYAEANSCTVAPRTMVTITVFPLPQLSITGAASVCPEASATLTITGASSYTWNNSSTSNTISLTPNTAGVVCMGNDINGCQSSISYTLGEFILPNVLAHTTRNTICKGETMTLTATGATSYSWNGVAGSSSLAVSPTISTTYTITGTDQNGCSKTSTVTQFVGICAGINEEYAVTRKILVYPNPNQGSFDVSLPLEAQLIVINQLGQIVFETRMQAGNNQVDTRLSKGIYICNIRFTDNSSGIGKLVIE